MVGDGADLHLGGVVTALDGEFAQQRIHARLHLLGLVVLDMIVAEQVQQPVDEHEAAFIGGFVAKARRLARNDLGREDDIAELENLVHRDILVKGGIALKREHVGGAVDVAPLAVEVVHLVLVHIGERDLDITLHALGGEHVRSDRADLVLGQQRVEVRVVTDEHGHVHHPFPCDGPSPRPCHWHRTLQFVPVPH